MIVQIELSAKRLEPMPDGLSLADQVFYLGISDLTRRFRDGTVSAEAAKAKMLDLRKAHDENAWKEQQILRNADLRRDITCAAINYQKNRTVENADVMLGVIDGFVRRVKEDAADETEMDAGGA